MDKVDSAFEEELNVLHSIFVHDELIEEKFDDRILLKFQINPDVVANTELSGDSRRYCSLRLEIAAKWNYPSTSPEVQIRNPRGLSEDHVEILNAKISSFLGENQGQCVLYDIIRIAQDFLTHEDFSLPKLPCCICLNQFEKSDSVYVTNKCHHHFHSMCIGRYVQHCIDEQAAELDILQSSNDTILEKICCPICRYPIPFCDIKSTLNDSKTDWKIDEDAHSYPSTSKPSWWHLSNPIERNFKSLYEKQKLQGGLIDLEEERRRMLITEETRLIRQTECTSSASDESEKKQSTSSSSQRKESQKWQNNFAVRRGGHYSDYNNRRDSRSGFQHRQQGRTRTFGNWSRSSRDHQSTSSRHYSVRTSTKATTSKDKSDEDVLETCD